VPSELFGAVKLARAKSGTPVCCLAIDAEEDFDWLNPTEGTAYSTACMKNIRDLQDIVSPYGVRPAYLLTYPVLEDADAVRIIRRQLETGRCIAGIQLHPWVTPPFYGGAGREASFTGNLDAALEERKLLTLKQKFIECFGSEPRIYRAGRYGLGPHSATLLERHGFSIDTSLAPRTNFTGEGGPDYTDYEYEVFWFGRQRPLLELPLCRSVVGWGGSPAQRLYHALSAPHRAEQRVPLRLLSALTRSRCAERITLSPEGNEFDDMRRLLRRLRERGQTMFSLSFHSSSLGIGGNPYIRSKADLHRFYDRLSQTLDCLANALAFRFASLLDVPDLLLPPPEPTA
jgi:hypothetical protein